MASFGICTDTSEAVSFYTPQGLFLKPIAKLNISVQLPSLKSPGSSISNWEVMERIKKMIKPDQFLMLKVAKSTLEFVRFEGEVESKGKLALHISQLDGKVIKLSGFTDALKVRAAEAKVSAPTKHDWDVFFRDAKNMNEMKAGERPDTIHIKDLPCRWFSNKKESDAPSELVVKKVFETFGEVIAIDIPMLDPYRKEMLLNKSNIQTFSFGQDFLFETFIQYKEYISFVKAMDALRGMKLLLKEGEDKALTATIKVDFDKTKHLSEKSIKKRNIERIKLIELEKERMIRLKLEQEEDIKKKMEEKKQKDAEAAMREKKRDEKLQKRENRRLLREDKRRKLRVEKIQMEKERQMQIRIALEERKILIAQRKLETIRLLSELFNRIKTLKQQEDLKRREKEIEEERKLQIELERQRRLEEERQKLEEEKRKREELDRREKELRRKILQNIRVLEERQEDKKREELRKKLSAKPQKLRSAVVKRTK